MKAWLRAGDFWSGLALAALGTYIVAQARGWEYMTDEGPGPGFFPMWYGSAMIVLSLALVAMSVSKRSAPGKPVVVRDLARGLGCWAAFVVCIALMPLAGFCVAFALLTWFIVVPMCGQTYRLGIILGVAGSIAFYLLFEVALSVSLPHGYLF
jgi:putative tricarboxylic transport membrane protein